MSMVGNYRRVSEEELSALITKPDSILEFLYSEESNHRTDRYLDIEKSWHAIHFLLNQETWDGSYPLVCVVMGGTSIGEIDVGYGPARYLNSKEVKDVANGLDEISAHQLLERFNADLMNQVEIYPHGWRDVPEEREYIQTTMSR